MPLFASLLIVCIHTSQHLAAMNSDDEAGHALLKPNYDYPDERAVTEKDRRQAWGHWIAHAILVSILVVLAATWKVLRSADEVCPNLQNYLPREAFQTHPIRFNGSIDFKSEWKGLPRPELEAAWNSITHDGKIILQREYLRL